MEFEGDCHIVKEQDTTLHFLQAENSVCVLTFPLPTKAFAFAGSPKALLAMTQNWEGSSKIMSELFFIYYHKNSRSTRKGQWNTPLSLLLIFYQFTPIRICASSESASRMMVFSLPVRLCFSASSAKVNS